MVGYGCGREFKPSDSRIVLDRFKKDITHTIQWMLNTYHKCGGDHPSGRTVWCVECAVDRGLLW